MSGWIKLHRSLIDWEWWEDHNATRLLIYLLCSVNREEKKWRGIIIPAGSMVLSWETLANSTFMTVKQCRVAMDKLDRAGETARRRAGKGQLVTLVKWDKLQHKDGMEGRQKGSKRTTTKEDKEIRNKEIGEIAFPFNSEKFKHFWKIWKDYKAQEHKFKYKSKVSEQAALKKLNALAAGDERTACDIIEQSLSNGWKGLFKLDNNGKNGNRKGQGASDEAIAGIWAHKLSKQGKTL